VIKKKKTLAVMRMDVFTCFYRNAWKEIRDSNHQIYLRVYCFQKM
jgi:hypothetical protein